METDPFSFWQNGPASDPKDDQDDVEAFGILTDAFIGSPGPQPQPYGVPLTRTVSLGEGASAAAQGVPMPRGAQATVGSPRSPALRRFASQGTGPFFGRERELVVHRAQRERAAFEQALDDICTDQYLGAWFCNHRSSHDPARDYAVWLRTRVPLTVVAKRWVEIMSGRFDLIERECADDFETYTEELSAALGCYRGKYYSNAKMLELPPEQRVGLHSVTEQYEGADVMETVVDEQTGEESQEPKTAYWLNPAHNTEGSLDYNLLYKDYGSFRNINNLCQSYIEEVDAARNARTELMTLIAEAGMFRKQQSPELNPHPGCFYYLQSREEAISELRHLINPGEALPSDVCVLKAKQARQYIMKRYENYIESMKTRKSIQDLAIAAAAARPSLMFEVFTDVDMWKAVIDYLDAPSAACMLRVYLGSEKAAPDNQVVELMSGRYPHLHIYETPGSFPHEQGANGDGKIGRNKYVEISIGFVTTTLRSTIRKERIAAHWHKPTTTVEAAADARRMRDNEGLTAAFLKEERHKDLVASNHDFGYDDDEDLVRAISADMLVRQRSSAPRRRVKNDGWSVQKVVVNDELQYRTHDCESIFTDQPQLMLKLVNADTGAVVDSKAEYGGLVPDKWLRDAGEIPLATKGPVVSGYRSIHVPRGEDQKILTLRGSVATLVRFRCSVLTSDAGMRFKVVVEATAKHRKTQGVVKLRAESKPMLFVSDPRKETGSVGRKRKVVDSTKA